ncbi:hypothetical protein ACXX84_02770 [Mycoplasma sp. AC157]
MKNNLKLKKINSLIKKNNYEKEYKYIFSNKKMYFLITKLALIFNLKIDIKEIYEQEISLIKKFNSESFIWISEQILNTDEVLCKIDNKKISTYLSNFLYFRVKIDHNNIFEFEKESRKKFNFFANELMESTCNFNYYITKILEVAK